MNFNVKDWVCHPKYGVGQITEDKGDKYSIHFVSQGPKLMVKSVIVSPGAPPYPGFRFPSSKATGSKRFKVERPPKRPIVSFDHLVKRFLDVFDDGFEGESFERRERKYKMDAVRLLHESLGATVFQSG